MSSQSVMNGKTRELQAEKNIILPLTGVQALHARVYAGVERQFNETIQALRSRKKIAGMVEECQLKLRKRLPRVIAGTLRNGGICSREDAEHVIDKIGKAISAERGNIGANITKPLLSAMSLYKQQFGDALAAAIPTAPEPQKEPPEALLSEEPGAKALEAQAVDTQPKDAEASPAPAADVPLSLSQSMCLLCDCKTTFQQKEFLSRGLASLFLRKFFAFVETLRPADGCVTLTEVRWLKKRWSVFAKKLEATILALDSLSLENIRFAVAESVVSLDESSQHSASTSETRSQARFAEDFSKRFVVGVQEYVQKIEITALLADIGIPTSPADIELSDIQLLLLPQNVNAEEDPPFTEREIELLRRNPDTQKSQRDFKRDVLQNDNALSAIARECNNELYGGLQVRTVESIRRMLSIFHPALLAGKDVFVPTKVHSDEETTPQVLLSENAFVDHPTTNEEIDHTREESNLPAEGDPPSEAELAFLIEEVGRVSEEHEGKDVSLSMFNHEVCKRLANKCNEKFYAKTRARKVAFIRRFVNLLLAAIDAGKELEAFILENWVSSAPEQEEHASVDPEETVASKGAYFTLTSSDPPALVTNKMSAEELLAPTTVVQDTIAHSVQPTAAIEKPEAPKTIGERIQEIRSQVSAKYGLNALVEKQAFSLKEKPNKAVRVQAAMAGLNMFVKNLGNHFTSTEASQGTVRLYVSLERQANERALSQLSSLLTRDVFVAFEKTLKAAFVEFEQRVLAELQPSLPEGDADAELTAFFSQGGHVWVDEVGLHFLGELADTLSHISAPKAKTQFQARKFASLAPIKFKNTTQNVRFAKMRRLQALTINFLSTVSEKMETFTTQALCNDAEYGAMLEPLRRSSQTACGRFRLGDPLSRTELNAVRSEFDLALERARDRLVQLQRQRVSATSATHSNPPDTPDLPIPSESLAEHDGTHDGFVRIAIPEGGQTEFFQMYSPATQQDPQPVNDSLIVTKERAELDEQRRNLEQDRASIDAQRVELEHLRNGLAQGEQRVAAEGQRLALLALELEASRAAVVNDQESLALQKRAGEIQLREIEELRTRVGEQLERLLQESDQVAAQRKLLDAEVRKLQDDKLALDREKALLEARKGEMDEDLLTLQRMHEELEEERDQLDHERDEAQHAQQNLPPIPSAKSLLKEREVTLPVAPVKEDKTSRRPRSSRARKGTAPQSTEQTLPPFLKAAWAEADAHAKTMVNAMMQLDRVREFAGAFIISVQRASRGEKKLTIDECKTAIAEHFPSYDPEACVQKVLIYSMEFKRRNEAMNAIHQLVGELDGQEVDGIASFHQKKAFCEQVRTDLSAELEGDFCSEDDFMQKLIAAANFVQGVSLMS